MRRNDKEIKEKKVIEETLGRASILHLAMVDGEAPYVVPMSFGYSEGCIYIHSSPEGRKIDILRKNNRVCFEVSMGEELVKKDTPCSWGMKYISLIGFGKAFFIEDSDGKRKGLDAIMKQYTGQEDFVYSDKAIAGTVVIRIDIDELSGKRSG